MQSLGLTTEEFQQVVRSCRTILINEFTPAADLQHFLAASLWRDFPETAAIIAGMNASQAKLLQMEILRAVNPATAPLSPSAPSSGRLPA